MLFGNPLLREVRAFYKEEYMIGTFALDLIERRLGIAFPVDEAASIALHIVNAEYNTNQCSRKVKEYIEKTYGHQVSEEEVAYLAVHLKRVRTQKGE